MSTPKTVTLDVRPLLATGQEPFGAIMDALEGLTDTGDKLLLIAPFEPAPLYKVLSQQGFDYETTALGEGSFQVKFTRR